MEHPGWAWSKTSFLKNGKLIYLFDCIACGQECEQTEWGLPKNSSKCESCMK